MPTFEYLRVSLAPGQRSLFDADMTRQEFLKEAFGRRWDFTYRKRLYTYDPITIDDGPVGGVVGREIAELHNAGPDTHWEIIEQKHWPIAYLTLDIGEREQIAAFQHHGKVGAPRGLLESLLEHITKTAEFASWRPAVEFVSSSADFWKAAEAYTGKITSLSFSFLPPNMLRAKEAIDDLVRAASDEANSTETEIKMNNPDGNLVPSGTLVEASVSTATQGGGEVTMKSGKKIIYSSSKNRKTKEIDGDDVPKPSSLEQVRGLFRRLLAK